MASMILGFDDYLLTKNTIFCSFSTNANVFSVMYGLITIFVASSTFNLTSPLIPDVWILSLKFHQLLFLNILLV